MALTGKQRRFLRGLGHHLAPVLQIGKEGITEALIAAADQALSDHELIKVKVGEASPLDRHEAVEALAEAGRAEVAQVLGRTALLFRSRPGDPGIVLPGAAGAKPSVPRALAKSIEAAKARTREEDFLDPPAEGDKRAPRPVSKSEKRHLPHRSSPKARR